jgi:hypothetical protein
VSASRSSYLAAPRLGGKGFWGRAKGAGRGCARAGPAGTAREHAPDRPRLAPGAASARRLTRRRHALSAVWGSPVTPRPRRRPPPPARAGATARPLPPGAAADTARRRPRRGPRCAGAAVAQGRRPATAAVDRRGRAGGSGLRAGGPAGTRSHSRSRPPAQRAAAQRNRGRAARPRRRRRPAGHPAHPPGHVPRPPPPPRPQAPEPCWRGAAQAGGSPHAARGWSSAGWGGKLMFHAAPRVLRRRYRGQEGAQGQPDRRGQTRLKNAPKGRWGVRMWCTARQTWFKAGRTRGAALPRPASARPPPPPPLWGTQGRNTASGAWPPPCRCWPPRRCAARAAPRGQGLGSPAAGGAVRPVRRPGRGQGARQPRPGLPTAPLPRPPDRWAARGGAPVQAGRAWPRRPRAALALCAPRRARLPAFHPRPALCRSRSLRFPKTLSFQPAAQAATNSAPP